MTAVCSSSAPSTPSSSPSSQSIYFASTPVSPKRPSPLRLWEPTPPTSPKPAFANISSRSALSPPNLENNTYLYTPPDTPTSPCPTFPRLAAFDSQVAPRKCPGTARPDQADIIYFQPEDRTAELRLEDRIGEGQWSTVWGATCVSKSEDLSKRRMSRSKLLAVKAVKGRIATDVALKESRVLSFLMADPEAAEYVVTFHGFSTQHNGLVMDFISLTLEDFAHFFNGHDFTQELLVQLQPIASACVAGLDYIHCHDIIHGDIKPSNILLRPIEQGSGLGIQLQGARFQPMYCDFSAARGNSFDCPPSESAGTYDFMAPELFSLSAPDNWTTLASDVYALGVSIIYMVIGQSPYGYAQNAFQRRAMAMSARPLEAACSDMQAAMKVQQTGLEEWVDGAVKPKALHRCSAREWKSSMMDMSSR